MQNKNYQIWAIWKRIININDNIPEKNNKLKIGSGATQGEKHVDIVFNKFGMCLLTNGHYIVSGSVKIESGPLHAKLSQGERVAIVIEGQKPILVYRKSFVNATPEFFFDIDDKILRSIVLGLAEGKSYGEALQGGFLKKLRNFFSGQ
jgi:hypothetical protein